MAPRDAGTGVASVRGAGVARLRFWIPAAVFVLGVLSVGLVFWIYRISERQRVNFQHIDAVTDLQVHAATFHLQLEEAFEAGNGEAAAGTLRILEEATGLSRALLDGGVTEHGAPMPPVDDPRFRQQAQAIAVLLDEFKGLASRRISDPKAAAPGSDESRRFDAAFVKIQQTARDLEVIAERNQADDHARTSRLLVIVVLVWSSGIAASTWSLLSLEARRRRAELALERAYDGMEQNVVTRTEELAEANRNLKEEVAERTRTEESLRRSEERIRGLFVQLRTLLDTMPDRIALLSRDLKILWANRGAGERFGPEARDRPGECCYTLWHERSGPCEECPAAAAFASGLAENARIATPDGRQWEIRAVPVPGPEGTIESVLEVATDITEKLALEADAVRAAHLASIGELAAGVAHEISNPVSGIINYAQILSNQSAAGTLQHEIATGILGAGTRVSGIVKALLSFARERREAKRPTSPSEIIEDALALTRSQMKKDGIRVVLEIAPDLPMILGNPAQLQQVVMNVVSNARYAMNVKHPGPHEGKVVEIRGESVDVAGTRHARIVIRDRGTGIPAGIVDRVVEPFFSTRPRGQATGLGLSISHGIVSDHGGRLSIESVEGEFTKVVIDLPAWERSHGENSRRR